MSGNANLTPPTGNSRSSSPGAGEAKPRAVSGSLKDRIAKFNNPSAAPLVPTHAFGTAGPAHPSTAAGRGLIGNRIPSLDPKTAGMIQGGGGQRKVSETKGMFGNRMPSQPAATAIRSAAAAPGSTGGRSDSPAGSIDSSSASGQPGSSASPNTSRSSSPPTSPGGGVPPSLLAATLPETGGPGAMTPSSTRAEAGEEATEFSPPSTPNANPELPPQDDNFVRSDLTPNNLPANAVSANPALKSMQSEGNAEQQHHAPSITSSMASQYDSKGSEDQTKMLQDVSGISTPMGTPRAANRDLEGSMAGSAHGEGSVADVDDLGNRLEGMDVQDREQETTTVGDNDDVAQKDIEAGDREATPEPIVVDHAKADGGDDADGNGKDSSVQDKGDSIIDSGDMDADAEALEQEKGHGPTEPVPEKPVGEGGLTHDPKGALADPDAKIEYTTTNVEQSNDDKPHVESTSDERDPNEDDDLDALKRGELHRPDQGEERGTHTVDQNPVNNLVEASLGQNVAEHHLDIDETKHQGGVAGQKMEDVENADEIVQPDEANPPPSNNNDDGGPDIREATPVSTADDEHLGPKGSLDGPQKFEVEWLEKGRGQSKAVDLDKQEYHWSKDQGADAQKSESGEAPTESKKSEDGKDANETQEAGKGENHAEQPSTSAAQETLQSQEGDKAAVLPDPPSTEPQSQSGSESSKPMQIHIEPGLIAQPETSEAHETSTSATVPATSVPDTSDEPTPSVEINPPTFPAPPSDDPDVVDPISHPQSRSSTPIDPDVARAFPEVPDEEKPRVEVHVSSPVNTPSASRIKENPLDPNVSVNDTPMASLPGKSKSLSHHDLNLTRSSSGEVDEADELGTPDGGAGSGRGGGGRRLSARRSPKSPLLDDEDPGDFAPGEGWAVVTKGRDK